MMSGKAIKEAGAAAQAGLDGLGRWCEENFVEVAPEKSWALTLTCDPSETKGKATPPLTLDGASVDYDPGPTILGVRLDSQLRFGQQAAAAARKLRGRSSVLQALAARKWGACASVLHRVYTSYVRPAGLYAGGVWYSFLEPTHRRKLESANYRAARLIAGVAAGARTETLVRDVGLPPLEAVAGTDGAKLLLHCGLFPPEHHLARLAAAEPRRRLKARGGGLRPCWRSEGLRGEGRLFRGRVEVWRLRPQDVAGVRVGLQRRRVQPAVR